MVEVERWWFRMHAGNEQIGFEYCTDETDSADFDDLERADAPSRPRDLSARDWLSTRRCARQASRGCRGEPRPHPEQTRNIRWIFLHMIEEYARHNGHADLIRECIDGAVGD